MPGGGRLGVVAIAAAVLALFGGGKAFAAAPFAPCPGSQQLLCAQIDVPLDRSGSVPGTVSLLVQELPADGTPRGVLIMLAGGPGQSGTDAFGLSSPSTAQLFRVAFPGDTLATLDVRAMNLAGHQDRFGLQRERRGRAAAVLANGLRIVAGAHEFGVGHLWCGRRWFDR